MSNLSRLILFLLGLFLIIVSLPSLFDIITRPESTGTRALTSPTPFTYLVTVTPTVPVNPATATVGAAFTQLAVATQTILPTTTAVATSTLAGTFIPPLPPDRFVLGQHIVRPTEHLFCIGRAYGVVPQAIASFNAFPPDTPLVSGQVLLIPNVPWMNIPPGPVCEAQFASPYPPTPSPTSTGLTGLIPSGPNSIQDKFRLISFVDQIEVPNKSRLHAKSLTVTTTPVPAAEVRTVYIEWPIKLNLGESDIIIMTFNPGKGQTTITGTPGGTSHGPTATPNPFRDADSSDAIDIANLFDEYRIFAIARLDAAGFDYAPREDVQKEIKQGKNLEWRWSIKPQAAQTQHLIVSLRLHFESRIDASSLPDEDIWNRSYQVGVTKNVMESLFGTQTGLLSGFGVVLGLVLTSFSVGKQAYDGLLWIGQKFRLAKKSADSG